MPHLWRCSRPGWMDLWATCYSGRFLCLWQVGWNEMIFKVLSSPSHSIILWLCGCCWRPFLVTSPRARCLFLVTTFVLLRNLSAFISQFISTPWVRVVFWFVSDLCVCCSMFGVFLSCLLASLYLCLHLRFNLKSQPWAVEWLNCMDAIIEASCASQ